MSPEQYASIVKLNAAGVSNREISRQVGLSHTTVAKVLSGNLAVATQVSTPSGNPRMATSGNPLIGLHLSPRELLDAKDDGRLPPTARLDSGGAVEVPEDGTPVWPSWEPTGDVRIGLSKQTYPVLKPRKPQRARRG